MPTTAWSPAVAGQQGTAAQLNQLLGVHPSALVYAGTVFASNAGAQASSFASNVQHLGQRFIAVGGAIDRVSLYVGRSGQGADVTVSIRDGGPSTPSATVLGSIVLPKEFVPASPRWVTLPLPIRGLSEGQTLWIVVSKGGDPTDHLDVGANAADTTAMTSADATTWASTTTQLLFEVASGATGLLRAVSEDGGARWTELVRDANAVLSGVNEYVGSFRNCRTLSYVNGVLTGVS